MTASQKQEIAKLRSRGDSYGKIALALGISQNTVKSFGNGDEFLRVLR